MPGLFDTPDLALNEHGVVVRGRRVQFSKAQRAFYAEHAPEVALDDLTVLGPIFVLKLKFAPRGYDRKRVKIPSLLPRFLKLCGAGRSC
jgi:hypothetical protein